MTIRGERSYDQRQTSFLQQTLPLGVNLYETLTNVGANLNFIPAGVRGATGLYWTDDAKVGATFIILIGSVVNSFAGPNAIDCTVMTDNLWQVQMDAAGWLPLANGPFPDGQMNHLDWALPTQGSSLGFAWMFETTAQLTNIAGDIGIRLENSLALAAGLRVFLSVFLKILWIPGYA